GDVLAAVLVGDADDRGLLDGRMGVEDVLDLTGPDLEAGGVDHALLPVDDEQPPVFAHESDISGAQFAVRDLLGGGLRIVEVLAYDLRAGDLDLTDFARPDRFAVVVEDADQDVRLGKAAGEVAAVGIHGCLESVRDGRHLSAGLRQSVALADVDARTLLELPDQAL